MTKTKVTRCAAASCRTLTAGKFCKAHAEPEKPARPAFDADAYLAGVKAEWEAMGNVRREQEPADPVGARAMLRHQLAVLARKEENRQPVFTRGLGHGL